MLRLRPLRTPQQKRGEDNEYDDERKTPDNYSSRKARAGDVRDMRYPG
jgi:hypothetical protein